MFSSNATQVSAVTQAEAVDYDSTNDYLSRSTYYNGYVNALTFLKETFTFSCWFYNGESTGNAYVFSSGASSGNANLFYVNISTTAFQIRAYDGSGTFILNATTTNTLPLNTFCNLIVSCDMTSTSNRYVYVNDQLMTMTWSNYVNSTIQFGTLIQRVNSLSNSVDPTACRISNVFLDFTYRDLSITANRRLFVTADLKPAAGQAALNPIVYLAMSDPTTVGTNTGTGGNFTLNGTVARSGRGPNQYNAPYSDLDGAADYLSRTTAPSGIANGKQFTLCFSYQPDVIGGTAHQVISFASSTNYRFEFYVDTDGSAYLQARNTAATRILLATFAASTFKAGRNYVVTFSVDLSDTAKRHIYINGQSVSPTWTNYSNDDIEFNIGTTPRYRVGANHTPSNFLNGKLGALWFNTSYIDLSVASNLAKFVSGTGIDAKPVDLGSTGELPTGTSPLIYLPMYGNNAGKNYGTGGDFTVNSGPYTGARGPNEFWGNKASGFNGSSDIYLTKATALSGVPTSGSTLSIVCWFNLTNYTSNRTIFGTNSAGTMTLQVTSGGNLFMWLDSSGYVQFSQVVPTGSWVCLMFSKTGSTYTVYVNDTVHTVDVANSFNRGNSVTYTNTPVNIATRYDGSSTGEKWYGSLSEFYFTTEYIDFSQEANRLKFRDALGNPVNLTQQIEAAAIPNPAIYMRFPPTSFGTNSGTGGDFTKTGTITDGGQL